MTLNDNPIGIFDSGIGGLSVLRHISEQLPREHVLYFADSAFSPYGEKTEEMVIERSLQITDYLIDQNCKALVIACNTATAAAIHLLRQKHPNIPIVGIEPGLKPASLLTQSRIVGVLATQRTLSSQKFQNLYNQLKDDTTFLLQPCPGLADCVEKNECDSEKAFLLLQKYIEPLLAQNADTLVLGCTHYPFLEKSIARVLNGRPIQMIDTGLAVTRQLIRLLKEHRLLKTSSEKARILAITTGNTDTLKEQFQQLLQMTPLIQHFS